VVWDEPFDNAQGRQWQAVHDVLNSAWVESIQGKWEEMFGEKEDVVEEKIKKPVKKRATSKKPRIKRSSSRMEILIELQLTDSQVQGYRDLQRSIHPSDPAVERAGSCHHRREESWSRHSRSPCGTIEGGT